MPTKTKRTTKIKAEKEEEIVIKSPSKGKYFYANGKRKTSVARVRLYKGEGEISVNNKPIEFASKELMVEYAKKLVKKKFNCDIDAQLKQSFLLRNIEQQSKLVGFI